QDDIYLKATRPSTRTHDASRGVTAWTERISWPGLCFDEENLDCPSEQLANAFAKTKRACHTAWK
ncbi:hypothetical protein V1478_014381, partial [Vespula squamosa]